MTFDDSSLSKTDNPQLAEKQQQIEKLQKELMDVYRLKREDDEALSRLKKQSHEHEALLIKRRDMLDEMSKRYEQVTNENQILRDSLVPICALRECDAQRFVHNPPLFLKNTHRLRENEVIFTRYEFRKCRIKKST